MWGYVVILVVGLLFLTDTGQGIVSELKAKLSGGVDFLGGCRAALLSQCPELSDAGRRIALAQFALESGLGGTKQSQPNADGMGHGFNVANIIGGASWTGPSLPGKDRDEAGNVIDQPGGWRLYDSYEDAIGGKGGWKQLLLSRYPDAWQALVDEDARTYVDALYVGGYFAEAPDTYFSGLSDRLSQLAGN